jgi:hypothetical protein
MSHQQFPASEWAQRTDLRSSALRLPGGGEYRGDIAASGIIAAWTAADIADLPPIDFRDPAAEALHPYRQPLLARERLRYVGEPIAAVFATDHYPAEDGAELVSVEADVLAPILDARAVPGSFAPGLSTEALVLRDVEAAFAAAHAIVALGLAIGRHSAVPIETRGALARFDAAGDVLELYGAAKVARMFDLSTTAVVLKKGKYRWRARSARRTLPRRFSCLRRRIAASDGRQPLARATPPGPRCIRRRGPGSRPSRIYSTSTRAPMCAPMAPGLRR